MNEWPGRVCVLVVMWRGLTISVPQDAAGVWFGFARCFELALAHLY